MTGHFVLAIPSTQAFFLGLILVIAGTGLLKPNVSAVVGELYPQGDPRRDGGFSIFYMGINLGAFLGPLICGGLAQSENFGWHWGFAAAGVGMLFGVIQFRMTKHYLGTAGLHPSQTGDAAIDSKRRKRGWMGVIVERGRGKKDGHHKQCNNREQATICRSHGFSDTGTQSLFVNRKGSCVPMET